MPAQSGPRPSTLGPVSERPAIIAIEEDADGDDVRVTITLDWGERHHYGTAMGRADPPHRPRLAAEAALQAVEQIGGDRVHLELMAVATADLGTARVALAQVRLGDDGEVLVGTALLAGANPSLAAVRAVMAAVNRRLGLIL
jgi:hypothetical protein